MFLIDRPRRKRYLLPSCAKKFKSRVKRTVYNICIPSTGGDRLYIIRCMHNNSNIPSPQTLSGPLLLLTSHAVYTVDGAAGRLNFGYLFFFFQVHIF